LSLTCGRDLLDLVIL